MASKRKDNKPKDPSRNPVRLKKKGEEDREMYKQWRAIPKMVRMLPPADLQRMGFNTDDPFFMKLVNIKTKSQFCEELKVAKNQPAKWDKEPDFITEVNALSQDKYVMSFRHDVDFAFTQKVLKHGDAHRMKLWKQLYEGWSERTESVNVNLNMTPADLVRDIEERNKKIRGEI